MRRAEVSLGARQALQPEERERLRHGLREHSPGYGPGARGGDLLPKPGRCTIAEGEDAVLPVAGE